MRPTTLLLVVGCALLSAIAAHADGDNTPEIVQTGCDTVGDSQVKIRFAFVNDVPELGVCNFAVGLANPPAPIPADACTLRVCNAPDGWSCGNGAHWHAVDESGFIDSGEQLDGFEIVVDPSSTGCCYWFSYYQCAILERYAWETVCFECDRPVQASQSTWGSVKATYR